MNSKPQYLQSLPQDLLAGLVVFLVALPLCLGVALASGAPPISGIVAGVVGGMLVVWISGSHTSISGPAAGLTAIVAAQIAILGSFEAFLVAIVLAGVLQLVMAALRTGSLAAFFPSSVINGLLAAIGIILILKQIPHLFGHNADWLGDLNFHQLDGENTFTELYLTLFDLQLGPTLVGLASILLLLVWDRSVLKKLPLPSPLAVVVLGIGLGLLFDSLGGRWAIEAWQLVEVPVIQSMSELTSSLYSPDYSVLRNPAIIMAAITIAVVASLETLLNVEAVDKLDPQKRVSPPNRELVAQGVGNIACGLLGGLPVTSVVVRSSVGINAGAKTRITCFVHGMLLLATILLLPQLLNIIPLSCLAAILLITGYKLSNAALIKQMWGEGPSQFIPFAITIIAIVFSDLLIGVLIGLFAASLFILKGNLRRPLRQSVEAHLSGEVTRIELAQHVSFLNRAALRKSLHELPDGAAVMLDARQTVYIDSDIVDLITEFEREYAPAHQMRVSRLGFKAHYDIDDQITHQEVLTPEHQASASPAAILQRLKDGNARYVAGQLSNRDYLSHVGRTAQGQYPLVVVLSCMDSRVNADMIFDMGLGDMFNLRVAGNIATAEALGGMEYGCAVAGAKVILVLGHSCCGAVNATVDLINNDESIDPGCNNLGSITETIARSVHDEAEPSSNRHSANTAFVNRITRNNVLHSMASVRDNSVKLGNMIAQGELLLCGGIYNVDNGTVAFLD
jgi:MFS superfamily sulfate permease-like transporter/carbonic anhydrase